MENGGARSNAGRKKGVPNKLSSKAGDRLAEMGFDPLERLVHFALARPIPARIDGADAMTIPTPDQQLSATQKLMSYVYPQLKAIEHTGKDGESLIPEGMVIRLVAAEKAEKS